jgi:putative hydrolase of HD superfamily
MRAKTTNPVKLLEGKEVHPLVRAYFELNQLKVLYRQGWLRRGISEDRCESVADHSFSASVFAMWLARAYFPELDLCKIMQMTLLHELGEIYAGDIVPADGISKKEKHRLEAESFHKVIRNIPGGEDYLQTWQEFEAGRTPEARFVRQVDRLEMGLQAAVYKLQGFAEMEEFFLTAREELEDVVLVEILDSLE